eukprot:scaffold926_cov408-Prasinococcus_capsulatus_cf.AAC.32
MAHSRLALQERVATAASSAYAGAIQRGVHRLPCERRGSRAHGAVTVASCHRTPQLATFGHSRAPTPAATGAGSKLQERVLPWPCTWRQLLSKGCLAWQQPGTCHLVDGGAD